MIKEEKIPQQNVVSWVSCWTMCPSSEFQQGKYNLAKRLRNPPIKLSYHKRRTIFMVQTLSWRANIHKNKTETSLATSADEFGVNNLSPYERTLQRALLGSKELLKTVTNRWKWHSLLWQRGLQQRSFLHNSVFHLMLTIDLMHLLLIHKN